VKVTSTIAKFVKTEYRKNKERQRFIWAYIKLRVEERFGVSLCAKTIKKIVKGEYDKKLGL